MLSPCREHLASCQLPPHHPGAGVLKVCDCMLEVRFLGPHPDQPHQSLRWTLWPASFTFFVTGFPRIILLTKHGELLFRKHRAQGQSLEGLREGSGETLLEKSGETCRTGFWGNTGAAFIESRQLPYCVPDPPASSGAVPRNLSLPQPTQSLAGKAPGDSKKNSTKQ